MNERFVRLGRTIKRARTQAKMTQQALADALDVSLRAVQQWEAGERKIAVDVLEDIAQAVGVHVIELLDSGALQTKKTFEGNGGRAGDIARLESKLDEILRRLPKRKQ